jgi:hypothetical protein
MFEFCVKVTGPGGIKREMQKLLSSLLFGVPTHFPIPFSKLGIREHFSPAVLLQVYILR